ncbi:MerR family transcriptional regulator [Streptomyces bacillaris]|uniref:MerR family transcriptional regulator n=1 Tax=Streptomyces bacillaris TaxID=68179 RepID=UPI003812C5F8
MGRVAELAGVSVRTLHHYDGIGPVRPSARSTAGYRAYSAADVERLREVLGYRRLGFGLREMRRVARRVVVFTYDAGTPGTGGGLERFWLTRDYLPEFAELLVDWPSLADLAGAVGGRAEPVLVPWDCADGFFEAHWRRPEAYLDEEVRRAVSVWTRVGPEAERRAVDRLREDLSSGRWTERSRDLAALDAAEPGLRLIVA